MHISVFDSERPLRFSAKTSERIRFLLCFVPPFSYALIFMILPYFNILQFSFWRADRYTVIPDLNLDNYGVVWNNSLYSYVILNSFWIASLVTVSSALAGYCLAYFVAFTARKNKNLLYLLIILPLWTSFLLRAYIWKIILGREGIINGALMYFGVVDEPISIFIYNNFSITLALTYVFIPFVALPVFTALERIPRQYVEASMDLGANGLKTFWRIILPLSLPGLIAGCIFTFCLSFGDFVTPTLLGGADGIMIANVIIGQFGAAFNWPLGSALAVVVIVVVLAVVGLGSKLEKRVPKVA